MTKLERLERRVEHLTRRINASPIPLSFDIGEREALVWAIEIVKRQMQKKQENGK